MKRNESAYEEWEKETAAKINFWFSKSGKELQLCLVAQGYEERLWIMLMPLIGNGFGILHLIKELRKEIEEKNERTSK